jgi:peptidoglycan/LPS O-acetylase OafA/YrhL
LNSPPAHRRIFSALDGLRGIAAIAVLTRHVPDKTLADVLHGSYLAVDLFFVLSGFVLAHSYLSRLRTDMSATTFLRVRLIRLYPLYILGTVLSLPHFLNLHFTHGLNQAADGGLAWMRILGSLAFALFFIPAPSSVSPDNHVYPLNHPSWSLFFELAINVIFALVAPRLTARLLSAILACGIILLAVTSIHYGDLDVGWQSANFLGGGGRVVYSFFGGVAAYQLWAMGKFKWFRLPVPVAALGMLIVFAADPPVSRVVYDLAVTTLIFPALVFGAAATEPHGLVSSICRGLGRASYAIYVLQIGMISWIAHFSMSITHRDFGAFGVGGTLIMIALIIGAALIFDRYYDSPTRSALSKLFRPRAKP